jgi:selenocysteine-specific elongation factor
MSAGATPPGLLQPHIHPEVLMMISTAGHVDHGKTRLVMNLTGCQTDRLKEEQERGLTIELGFAPCFLGDNLCVGIVDVPGHERFVRTMVAGVSGIDLTVLIIAADDGIMPQTVEHLQIMELMGVRHGMVALTKIDLVDPARVTQRTAEIAEFLKGTFLEGSPICPVSSETGEGYAEFYGCLVGRIKSLQRRPGSGVFRMPVERVFTQQGFGEVVTGIPVAGCIRIGDAVSLTPGGQTGRVRGVQCFGRDSREGQAGQCLALNVPEWGKTPPVRGQVMVPPGYLPAATQFHVRIKAVPRLDPPLRHAEEVQFHTGTAESPARIFLLEDKTLPGGGTMLASVVTDRPLAAAPGDRFILRRAATMTTVAGGRIRLTSADALRPRRQVVLAQLTDWETFFAGIDPDSTDGIRRRVEYAVRQRGAQGATLLEAARDAMLPAESAQSDLVALRDSGQLLEPKSGTFLHVDNFRACRVEIESRLKKARDEEHRLNLPVSECRQGLAWSAVVWSAVLRDLEKSGRIGVQGDMILLQANVDGLSDPDRELAARLLALYEESGYHSPRPDELPERLAVTAPAAGRMLDFLLRQKKLVKVDDNVVLAYTHYKTAQDLAVETIKRDGVLNSPAFRDRLQTTRKYAMAILDFMDRQRITMRVLNDRRLMSGYERNLL